MDILVYNTIIYPSKGGKMTKKNRIDLEVGMILAADIYGDTGAILIGAGTVLDITHLNFIERNRIDFVYISEGRSHVASTCEEQSKHNVQERHDQTVSKFKNVYFDFRLGRIPVFQEIEDIVEPLYDSILNDAHFTSKMWQIHAYDDYTFDHSVRVSMISGLLAKWCGLSETLIKDAATSGLLHDIGKCNIPDEILNKPAPLDPDEYKVIKTHATLGYILVKEIPNISENIIKGVLQHHERMDGTGYPTGLKGNEIDPIARIVAIADVYCAMTSDRVYKPAFHPFEVTSYILEKCYHTLDFSISKIFLSKIAPFFIGQYVKLNNEQCGEIVMTYNDDPARPLVRVGETYYDLRKHIELEIIEMVETL